MITSLNIALNPLTMRIIINRNKILTDNIRMDLNINSNNTPPTIKALWMERSLSLTILPIIIIKSVNLISMAMSRLLVREMNNLITIKRIWMLLLTTIGIIIKAKINHHLNSLCRVHLTSTVDSKCRAIPRSLALLYPHLSFKLQTLKRKLTKRSLIWVIAIKRLKLFSLLIASSVMQGIAIKLITIQTNTTLWILVLCWLSLSHALTLSNHVISS